MSQTDVSGSIQEMADSLTDLFNLTLNTGVEMLKIFSTAGQDLTSTLTSQSKSMSMKKSKVGGCCKIPPPCWMPRELTSVTSHVCAGATASLCFRITNCGVDPRKIRVEADPDATIKPVSLELKPFRSGSITVSFAASDKWCDDDCKEILIFVHGCRSYYLRWTIQNSKRGCGCCHEIEIDDCPDQIHHWYDHFYCQRPCQPQVRVPGQ